MVDYTQYAAQRREEQERRRLPADAPVQGRVVQPEPKGPSSKDQLYGALIQTAAGLVRAGGEAAMQYGVQTALGEQRHGQRLTEITKEDEFATGRATVRSKHETGLQKDRLKAQIDQVNAQTWNSVVLSNLSHSQQIDLKDHEQKLKIDFWNLTRPKGKNRGKVILYNGNLVLVKDLEKRRDFHINAFKKVGDQVYGLENRKEAMDIQAALDQAFKDGRVYNGVKHAQKTLKSDQDVVSAWNFGTGPLREIVGEGAVPKAEVSTGKTSTGKPRYVTEAKTGIDESPPPPPPPTPAAARQRYNHANTQVDEAITSRNGLRKSLMDQGFDPEGADSHLMGEAKQIVANKMANRDAAQAELDKSLKAREKALAGKEKKKGELGWGELPKQPDYGETAQEDIDTYNLYATDPTKRGPGQSYERLLRLKQSILKRYPGAWLKNPVPDAPQGTSVEPPRQTQIAISEQQRNAQTLQEKRAEGARELDQQRMAEAKRKDDEFQRKALEAEAMYESLESKKTPTVEETETPVTPGGPASAPQVPTPINPDEGEELFEDIYGFKPDEFSEGQTTKSRIKLGKSEFDISNFGGSNDVTLNIHGDETDARKIIEGWQRGWPQDRPQSLYGPRGCSSKPSKAQQESE